MWQLDSSSLLLCVTGIALKLLEMSTTGASMDTSGQHRGYNSNYCRKEVFVVDCLFSVVFGGAMFVFVFVCFRII